MNSLIDRSMMSRADDALAFVVSLLSSSTEYSIIGKDLDGKILLWNEGARRLCGYAREEVIGKLNSEVLHVPEDVASDLPRRMMDVAVREGKWEGVIRRVRKNGEQFTEIGRASCRERV